MTVGGKETPATQSKKLSTSELLRTTNKAQHNLNKLVGAQLKKHKLNFNQWLLLGAIYEAGDEGVGISIVARKLGINTPQITLASQGLVVRHAVRQRTQREDRRSKKLFITARGRVLFTDSEAAVAEVVTKLLESIPAGHMHFYHRISLALANTLNVLKDGKT